MTNWKNLLEFVVIDLYLSESMDEDGDVVSLLTLEIVDGSYVSVELPDAVFSHLDGYEVFWSDSDFRDSLDRQRGYAEYYDDDDLPF